MNETRARFVGYDVWLTKWAVFTLSGAFAGLAGGLLALTQESAYPDVMSLHASGFVVMTTLIGGGFVSFWGPVIGALVFILARDVLGAADRDLAALVRPAVHGDGDRSSRRAWPASGARSQATARGARARRTRRATGARDGRSSRPRTCTSASATRVVLEDISLSFEPGQRQRHHGAERRRQVDLLQCADRALSPRSRRGHLRRRGHHRACRRSAIARKGISRSFQIMNLFDEFTALENVMLALPECPRAALPASSGMFAATAPLIDARCDSPRPRSALRGREQTPGADLLLWRAPRAGDRRGAGGASRGSSSSTSRPQGMGAEADAHLADLIRRLRDALHAS